MFLRQVLIKGCLEAPNLLTARVFSIYVPLACVASVSNRVIARKLERKQKKVEGGGEKRKRLPANPTILENAP